MHRSFAAASQKVRVSPFNHQVRLYVWTRVSQRNSSTLLTIVGAVGTGATMAFAYNNCYGTKGNHHSRAVVHCKPIDTPEYLIPFHLRSIRARFNHYASIRKKGGVRYMTAEDFVCALLASSETNLKSPHAASDLKKLFQAIDTNGDGRLSLPEFSFLVTLLAAKKQDLKLAFTMFDSKGNSTSSSKQPSLTLSEFSKLIATISTGNAAVEAKNGLVQKLFGADGNKRCTQGELIALIDQLRMEVWKAEFRQYDPRNVGAIEAEDFGELIASHLVGIHLPFYLVENLRKMREDPTTSMVPFSMWVSFSRMLENADTIGEAIEVYTSSGKSLRKEDFNRAVTAVGLPKLADQELSLIFSLFDRNGDGSLEYDEFLSIMKKRVSFHVNSKIDQKVRESVFSQFAKCSSAALF